jgi:predicted nucleic acid-binding protein
MLQALDQSINQGPLRTFSDVHLLAAAALNDDARLWTRDKRLKRVAVELDLAIEL